MRSLFLRSFLNVDQKSICRTVWLLSHVTSRHAYFALFVTLPLPQSWKLSLFSWSLIFLSNYESAYRGLKVSMSHTAARIWPNNQTELIKSATKERWAVKRLTIISSVSDNSWRKDALKVSLVQDTSKAATRKIAAKERRKLQLINCTPCGPM